MQNRKRKKESFATQSNSVSYDELGNYKNLQTIIMEMSSLR